VQDRAALREIGRRHAVCPYYLSQELARWADVIVGDYNYYLDLSALLYALSQANQWKVAVLIDEAHNLVERGRAMFSAQLDRAMLVAARHPAPRDIKRNLQRVIRHWDALVAAQRDTEYRVYQALPEQLLRSLETCIASVADFSAQPAAGVPPELLDFYFRAIQFCRLAADLDRDTICDLSVPVARGATRRGRLSVCATPSRRAFLRPGGRRRIAACCFRRR
jgi:Rad3-related DNA helicase